MIVMLAFAHGIDKDWKMLDKIEAKAVQWWAKSKYYHVELVVDGKMIGAHKSGVKVKDVNYYKEEFDKNMWVFVPIEIEDCKSKIKNFWDFAYEQEGKKYDWKGIYLTQFVRVGLHCYQCWFCSELVTKLLQVLGEPKALRLFPSRISPQNLFDIYYEGIKYDKLLDV